MTNKGKLKKAIEQDIDPKNYYHEIITKIAREEKIKKNNAWKWSLVPICLVIVISGVLFLNFQKTILKNKTATAEKNNTYLKINNINQVLVNNDIAGSAIDITFEELIEEEKFIANIKILSSLNHSRLMKRYNVNNEFIGYDLIYYSIDNNNQVNKQIEIFFSKTLKNKPNCYKTVNLDKLEDSKINNTSVKVLKYKNIYYHALFNYNNYNFDIEANNISEQELSNILLSIIK